MSKFKDLEKRAKMVFYEEEENPEKIIEKEQNAINDFIANLDEDIYKDVSRFPVKYPERITYPESIKMDDFIFLSVGDEFYLFPKMFEDKISDYLEYKKYFKKAHVPNSFVKKLITPLTIYDRYKYSKNFCDYLYTGVWIAIIFILLGLYVAAKANTFLIKFICVVGFPSLVIVLAFFLYWRMLRFEDEVQYISYEENFTELTSRLKVLDFPFEFFDKHFRDIKVL